MEILKIVLGLVALLLAWLFLFRKKWLFTLNEFMRRRVFSDTVVLFQGRRMAALLFALGAVAMFSGIEGVIDVQAIKPHIAAEMQSQAHEDFRLGRYTKVVNRCRELVRVDPKNLDAWELLANAWWAMGQKDRAAAAAEAILRVDPNHSISRSLIVQYYEEKNPTRERVR